MQGNNEVRNDRQEFSHSAALTVPVQKQPWSLSGAGQPCVGLCRMLSAPPGSPGAG